MFSCRTRASRSAAGWWWWAVAEAALLPTQSLLWDRGAACPCGCGFLLPPGVWWQVRGCVDLDPADSSTAFSTAACWGPTRKNRLLSWQGNIIHVLQAGRLRRRVYFGVTHSGWPGSLWRTWKFNVSQSPDPDAVLPLPVLLGSWAGTTDQPGMLPCPAALLARVSGSARGAASWQRGVGGCRFWGATQHCQKAWG